MLRTSTPARWRHLASRAAIALIAVLALSFAMPGSRAAELRAAPGAALPWSPHARPGVLSSVKSWGYQLQHIKPAELAAAPYDLIVIDYSKDGSQDEALTRAEVERLKRKPDGSRRIVLSYLSIGEAEDYRYYWRWYWKYTTWPIWSGIWRLFGEDLAPAWIGGQNPEWRGNYSTRFWLTGWRRIIFDGEKSYLSRIQSAGFDGVYLDKTDVTQDLKPESNMLRRYMTAFVTDLAARARIANPDFAIVPQNGEELLLDAGYRAVISGIGKEDLLFGEDGDAKPNTRKSIQTATEQLQLLRAEGKPVLAVEYLKDPREIAETRKTLDALGFIAHFADRDLGRMRFTDVPSAAAAGTAKQRGGASGN